MNLPQNSTFLNQTSRLFEQEPSTSNTEWDAFCSHVKQTMPGSEEEKDNILRRRLLKFFQNFSLEENRYFVKKREIVIDVDNDIQFSLNSILLYGVDFMPEAKIHSYFHPYQIMIEHYDDSHCSVTFASYELLVTAVFQHYRAK